MLTVPPSVRIFLALGATDMRKSFDTCRRNRLKILVWDNSGFWLHAKRLEKGYFAWPGRMAEEETSLEMDARELSLLIGGIDLRRVQRRDWYDRAPAGRTNSNRKKILLHA